MIPAIVHRYYFSMAEAAQALLADQAGDCGARDVRIEAGRVVVDVIEPASAVAVSQESPPAAPESPAEPARKGGPLAMKAGILCGEKAFQNWLDVATPDAAKAKIYERCGIGSRVDLDHDEIAAAKFREMTVEYDVWCEYAP
jgi:hypothetical protein